jgi:metallo-beta-lactamase class B
MSWRGRLGAVLLLAVLASDARAQPAPPAKLESGRWAAADAGAALPATPAQPASIFGTDTVLAPGTKIQGNPDKEIIRRIIRRHINEVKSCYERELVTKPSLFGTIKVDFTIGATGDVLAASRGSSTMNDRELEDCTVAALRTWRFPKPLGGVTVKVTYPFELTPSAPIPVLAGSAGAGEVALDLSLFHRGIIVHRSTDAHGVPANGVVVITEGGLLLVDTGWTAAQTEAILKWGDDRLQRPWVGAVITHDHADRDGGLAALLRRHIPVAALDLTVTKLAHRNVHGVGVLFAARDGALLDPRGFEAFYPGPGHTSDNIVVRHGDVLFAGCLVKSMEAKEIGFTGDADLAAWPAAVRRVSARYGKLTLVPGHGAIDSTGRAYQHTLDLLSSAPPLKH